ncbi:hypothetical protein C5167_041887, partial [Papaver somniferum]
MAGAMVRQSACALLLLAMVLAATALHDEKKTARCVRTEYPNCFGIEHVCPFHCPRGDCKDHDFCLVSDSNLHINARFIGRRNQNMMRDFTWVQSIGAIFDSHKLFIVDRLAVTIDGEPIELPLSAGAKWESNGVSITRSRNTNSITVEVESNFKITANVVPITEEESRIHNYGITQEDCFAHLELGFKFYSLSSEVNGVLGQTYGKDYTSKVNMSAVMPVMGGTRKFLNSALFSTGCSVSRFGLGAPVTAGSEFAGLECGSSMEGRGLVCARSRESTDE